MILAGDIGATKSLIGLFERSDGRPAAHRIESFPTMEFDGLPSIVRKYLASWPSPPAIEAAGFGVAGPVIGQHAQMTNVEWQVSADEMRRVLGVQQVRLLNDLEAMAHAIPVLQPAELHALQPGAPRAEGNAVLIAAGTGMGQSILHRVDGRLRPIPTEGGHVDFAARTDREWDLVRILRERHGRAHLEGIVSGLGIINVAQFTHSAPGGVGTSGSLGTTKVVPSMSGAVPSISNLVTSTNSITCPVAGALDANDSDSAARVSAAAMARTCPHCIETMEIFVSAYGAAAGNLALLGMAGAGVYIGGGIAPRILPLMTDGRFLDAFRAKAPMDTFLARVPVHVVLNRQAGILGAAVAVSNAELRRGRP